LLGEVSDRAPRQRSGDLAEQFLPRQRSGDLAEQFLPRRRSGDLAEPPTCWAKVS